MNLSNFAVSLDDGIYETARRRAEKEGKSLDLALADLLTTYAQGESKNGITTYTVQRGDTLARIANQVYGDPHQYPVIQRANKLNNPGQIWVGQILVIPAIDSGGSTPSEPVIVPTPVPSPEPIPSPPTPIPTPTAPPPSQPTIIDYVQAMPAGFRADRAGGLQAVYQFQVSSGSIWTLTVANGRCSVAQGQTAPPTVIIGIRDDDYISLAEGQFDAVQTYRQGRLRINGDLQLAAKIGEIFEPWAHIVGASPPPAPPVPEPPPEPQPPAPPPVSPSQPTLADYVQAMPAGFRADRAGGLNVVYLFQITNTGPWTIAVNNGQCTAAPGQTVSPNVVVAISDTDFIKLSEGRLNAVQAYQRGQIGVSGDRNLAIKIADIFGPWAQAVGATPPVSPPEPPTPEPVPEPIPEPEPEPPTPAPGGSIHATLLNGSFDDYQPYIRDGEAKVWKEDQFPEEYGAHWTLEVIDERRPRVHLMNSGVFGRFTQKYFGGGGLDYHQHGRYSQVVTSRYGFDLVFSQTIASQPGRSYTFKGMIVSFYKGTSGERRDGIIFKTIGIDPTGGGRWDSANVVWGDHDGKDNEWRYPSLRVQAQANAITVFIRLENIKTDVGETELNTIHLERFELE